MATVIPNRSGEALQRSTENLLNAFIQKRRLDLEERRIDQQAQLNALNTLGAMVPFIPHGQSVADTPWLHDTLRAAIPDVDPSDVSEAGFGSLVFNQRTLDDVLQPLYMQRLEELQGEAPEFLQGLMDRGIARAATGETSTPTQQALENTRLQLMSQSLEHITQNEDMFRQVMRGLGPTVLGLDQPVSIRIPDNNAPGGFREVTWDTNTAAALSVDIWKFMHQTDGSSAAAVQKATEDMAGRLISQAKDMDISLGEPVARQIIGAYMEGDVATLEQIASQSPELEAVVGMFTGAASLAENGLRELVRNAPGGEQYANFLDALDWFSEIIPAEHRLQFFQTQTEILDQLGIPIMKYTGPGFLTPRRHRTEFRPPSESEVVQSLNEMRDQIPFESRLNAAWETYSAGEMTLDQIREVAGEDVAESILNLEQTLGSIMPGAQINQQSAEIYQNRINDIQQTIDQLSTQIRERTLRGDTAGYEILNLMNQRRQLNQELQQLQQAVLMSRGQQ